jgi:cell division protein FtsB
MAKRKKKFVRIFSSKLVLFLLIIACAGLAKVTIEKYIEVSKAKATLKGEEKKVKENEEKSKKLEEMINYFQSKEYLESIARKKLNLVKPGEKVIYVIPEKMEAEKKESQTKNNNQNKKNFFEKVKEFLRIK